MFPERAPLLHAARISTADVARSGPDLGFPTVIGDEVWGEEDRPAQHGRPDHRPPRLRRAAARDPASPWDARTRVHEYGGRSYPRHPRTRRRLRRTLRPAALPGLRRGSHGPSPTSPTAVTPTSPGPRGRIFGVQEKHHDDGKAERAVVAVSLDGSVSVDRVRVRLLRLAPPSPLMGSTAAYIRWNHPRMPRVGTELRITRIDDGSSWTVKGGQAESVLAPTWKDDRNLYLVSDWSGWWNLYQIGMFGTSPPALFLPEEEFAGPLWQLGGRPYVVLGDGRLGVLHGQGNPRLGVLDVESGLLDDLDVPYDGFQPALSADGRMLVGIGYGWDLPRSVVRVDIVTGRGEGLRRTSRSCPTWPTCPGPRR